MKLRELRAYDAPFMLEWMKDPDINRCFKFDSSRSTLKTAGDFIKKSETDVKNRHYAVTTEEDEYIGTASLKEIDNESRTAEYAICIRKMYHGSGAAAFATKSILNIAFNELNLNKVYLNVLSDNKRAIRFYEKMGFIFEGEFKQHFYVKGEIKDIKWFRLLKEEYISLGDNNEDHA